MLRTAPASFVDDAAHGGARTGKRRELLRFATVGLAAFGLTLGTNYGLKLTVLQAKPVTALAIATVVATAFAYLLSRRWAFHTRGGRRRLHEAALFFAVNAIAVTINLCPPLISRYVLRFEVPEVSFLAQEIADFVSGMLLGTAAGSAFRWWGYRRWVFPVAGARQCLRNQTSAGLSRSARSASSIRSR
ncbi:GtrA family protein [Amycolatopsis sp. BJA-103]|uniref:GtrA family protein n=1 Tax=unclassified Amycolatopsis TaxID=2618356 RepID=UPI001E3926AE|nr:GtrA family protein [Amycolatopsis sp. BJA-103]